MPETDHHPETPIERTRPTEAETPAETEPETQAQSAARSGAAVRDGAQDAVFRALSDPGRRTLLDRLNDRNGLSLSDLCLDMGMTRQSVTKHLHVLEAANLVTAVRKGRERLHFLNAAPINDIADRWIHSYDRARAEALSDLKTALEATPMEQRTAFVYTHLHRSHSRAGLARAHRPRLHDPLLAPPGLRRPDAALGLEEGLDLRRRLRRDRAGGLLPRAGDPGVRPYRRLAYTWHTFSPEWAAAHGIDEKAVAAWRAEPRSKVAFDIEEAGPGVVKLTVVHDGFEPGSGVLEGVSHGWPAVVSSLKTLLETGSALPSS